MQNVNPTVATVSCRSYFYTFKLNTIKKPQKIHTHVAIVHFNTLKFTHSSESYNCQLIRVHIRVKIQQGTQDIKSENG